MKKRSQLYFEPIIEKTKKKFNLWLMRDISIFGRVLLSKAEGISRSVYTSLSLDVPPKIIKDLDQILYNFIWRKKTQVICNPKEQGGLEVLDYNTLNDTFKIKCLIEFVKNRESPWNAFPNYIFNTLGGIYFLLKCNFSVDNFSPHNYFIWNNKDILFENKSLFYHTWFKEGIILVGQLVNSHGYLLSYTGFLQKFQLPVKPREFAIVFDAIPKSVMLLLKYCNSEEISMVNPSGNIFIENVDVLKQQCSNMIIRNALCSVSLPTARFFWSSLFGNISWVKAWKLTNKFCINNKIKEVSYKILHRIYPAKHVLERFKLNI